MAPAIGDGPGRVRIGAGARRRCGCGLFIEQRTRADCRQHVRGHVVGRRHDLGQMTIQIAGVDAGFDHRRVPAQTFQKIDVALGADHHRLRQGLAQQRQGLATIGLVHDQLGDHRVVMHADRIALDHPGIDAHASVGLRQVQQFEFAAARQKALFRILGVQAHFDGVAARRHRAYRHQISELGAGGDLQLQFDQIQSGDHLGHRMLHLQSGVDLHEIEIAGGTDDELDRAGIGVVDGLAGLDGGGAHGCAQLGGDERRGRFFDDLLIASLGRALALIEVDHLARMVAEDLDLDMARALDIALQQHPILAESAARLALAGFQCGLKFGCGSDHTHALAAAAVGRLDHQRKTHALGFAREQRGVLIFARVARHHRHAGRAHQVLGTGLAAHLAHRGGAGAHPDQSGRDHGIGKFGVLAEESEAWMDGLGTGSQRSLDDPVSAQVRIRRRRSTDPATFVGQAHMLRTRIGIGIDRNRGNAQMAAGALDTAGDLTAIGNQELGEHAGVQRAGKGEMGKGKRGQPRAGV